MKAVVDVVGASTGAGSNLSGVQSGRVNRRKDVENEEIQMYLSKLKDLVPFMPKNKKLTKLEVIEYVIDYICDLQYALETHPSVNNLNAAELTARLQGENGTSATTVHVPASAGQQQQRQPLGVLAPSPNTIVQNVSCKSPVQSESTSHRTMSPVLLEKVQETDSRPISC
ncbi:UNVERIFIED_CONTAM: hypothetical protein PYX00_008449 [Menopon gallinae]|uniref:BHLH domain-containing protein n=1 Tax=Menopon gallinae TaxID=328185 RepID=A0AAW2HNW4_9NEOP